MALGVGARRAPAAAGLAGFEVGVTDRAGVEEDRQAVGGEGDGTNGTGDGGDGATDTDTEAGGDGGPRGELYGVPWQVGFPTIQYRKDLVTDARLRPGGRELGD